MYTYFAYGLAFVSEIPLPECSRVEQEEPDFSIVVSDFEVPFLERTNIHRKGVMADCAMDNSGSLVLYWEGVAAFRATEGSLLEVKPLTRDASVLSLFILSEAIGLILFQRGYYLLHASAVKVGNEAWVFMGTPGAGKSTTSAAFVKAGCPVLSDDMTAICPDREGVLKVMPAFAQLKVWEGSLRGLGYDIRALTPVVDGINKYFLEGATSFEMEPVQLGRLYFLHQDEARPELQPLKAHELPVETLKHFPLANPFLTEEVLRRLFAQSLACGRAAQAFHRRRPAGFSALEAWVSECVTEAESRIKNYQE